MMPRTLPARVPRPASITALLAGSALLVGACGGSSSGPDAGSSSANVPRAGSTARSAAAAALAAARSSRRNVIATPTKPLPARDPEGMLDDEVNPSGSKLAAPCSLVSRSQAQAILHGSVAAPVSAQQGPTCIYKTTQLHSLIALAVQGRAFSTLGRSSQLRHRISIEVSGRPAYCGLDGTTGEPTLIMPLSYGRLLVIAAPCPIAASFAATALPRIPPSAA
jgi:hypothetical protein